MYKTALTIDDLVKSGPLGRTSIYEAIKAGHLTARKYGRRTFVLTADFDEFLHNLPRLGERRIDARHSPAASADSPRSEKPRDTAGARNPDFVRWPQPEKKR